jgi:hypothetical protein
VVKTGAILCGLAALGIGALTPFLPAQTQTDSGSPVIQVESREVPVDVIVTGKAAGAVKLTAKDFSIREDGKAQKINSVEPAAADPATSLKHFVLYFDTSAMTMADQQASKDAATSFVESMASPDRYMAVVNMTTLGSRVLQDFTTFSAPLSKAIAGVGLARAPISPLRSRLCAVRWLRRLDGRRCFSSGLIIRTVLQGFYQAIVRHSVAEE